MKKNDILTTEERTIMYSDEKNKKKSTKTQQKIDIKTVSNTVILESNGLRYQVPTMVSYQRLVQEYEKSRNDLLNALSEIKKLTEVIRRLDADLAVVEESLNNKMDKP